MCTFTAPHSDTQLHLSHKSIDFLRNQRKRHHQSARRKKCAELNIHSSVHPSFTHEQAGWAGMSFSLMVCRKLTLLYSWDWYEIEPLIYDCILCHCFWFWALIWFSVPCYVLSKWRPMFYRSSKLMEDSENVTHIFTIKKKCSHLFKITASCGLTDRMWCWRVSCLLCVVILNSNQQTTKQTHNSKYISWTITCKYTQWETNSFVLCCPDNSCGKYIYLLKKPTNFGIQSLCDFTGK